MDSTERTTKSSSSSMDQSPSAGSAPSKARQVPDDIKEVAAQLGNRVTDAYDQTKEAVTGAYDKTSEIVSDNYQQVIAYGRKHPGTLTLISLGAGVGIGLLLASGRKTRTSRIIGPVAAALSQVASEVFR
jgi:hypothetical protein